ncbi:DNA-binding related protein [Trifolium pratense]|uniref:DNA-binding related protein n=1 Tax=Trifolium pratense TaxID=57577 RepID=A0A2K3LG30_TRIPR|nr:DNA-binding related protein [Trifolium pratense]
MSSSKGTDRKVQSKKVEATAPLVQAPPVNNERKVEELLPDMKNINITVKVLEVEIKYRSPRIVDSLVGDETGVILLRTVDREQAKRVRVLSTIRLRNARIDLFNNNMILKVKSATDIEDAPAAEFIVDQENNMSLHRYTLRV